MDFGRNQQNGQLMRNVLSQQFGKITKMVLAVQSVIKADWTSPSCGAHEKGIPARYYQDNKVQNEGKYNSRLMRGLCANPLGKNSPVGAAQRAFNNIAVADENPYLQYLHKPEEQKKELCIDIMASSVDKKCFYYNCEDAAEDAECEMEEIWHIHDIYSQTISAGNQTPMANKQEEED